MSSKIVVEDLEMVYPTSGDPLRVLGPISFEIQSEEFVCIVGESGCGKSTFLRLLAGLELPCRGRIVMDGDPITGPSSDRGFVFQQPALLPWLNVQKNIEIGFRIRDEEISQTDVQATIEMVGLKGFEKSYPRNLSGGMGQRAAIARALVSAPDVLLMDEPFSALDAITRKRMQRELSRIWQQKKTTIVFVTHDTDEAVSLGTRIVLMTRRPGRIGRVFQVPLEFPRSPRSIDVLRIKALIAEEFTDMVNGMTPTDTEAQLWPISRKGEQRTL